MSVLNTNKRGMRAILIACMLLIGNIQVARVNAADWQRLPGKNNQAATIEFSLASQAYFVENNALQPGIILFADPFAEQDQTQELRVLSNRFLAQGFVVIQPHLRAESAKSDLQNALTEIAQNNISMKLDLDHALVITTGAAAGLFGEVWSNLNQIKAPIVAKLSIDGVVMLDSYGLDWVSSIKEVSLVFRDKLVTWLKLNEAKNLTASFINQIAPGRTFPPVLLMPSMLRAGSVNEAQNISARLREAAISSTIIPTSTTTPALVQLLSLPGDSQFEQILAWIRSREVARVTRFEQLNFSLSGAANQNKSILRGGAVEYLRGHRGKLFAAIKANKNRVSGAQVWRLDQVDGDWVLDQQFPKQFVGVSYFAEITFPQTNSDGVAPTSLLIASLLRADGSASWFYRQNESWNEFSQTSDRLQAISAIAVDGEALWLGTSGPNATIYRAQLNRENAALKLDLRKMASEIGSVTGFARANGEWFATVDSSANNKSPAIALLRFGLNDAKWKPWRLRVKSQPIAALHAPQVVPNPLAMGGESILLVDRKGGNILRLDPLTQNSLSIELDYRNTFQSLWGEFGFDSQQTSEFVALQHPQSGDLVHALGLGLSRVEANSSERGGGYFLLRQLDAGYSFGWAKDFSAQSKLSNPNSILSVAPSPFQMIGKNIEIGSTFARTSVFFGGQVVDQNSAQSAVVFRGDLQIEEPPSGFWWNKDRPGYALGLYPLEQKYGADKWMAIFFHYDKNGESVWSSAVGQIKQHKFVSDSAGLLQYRQSNLNHAVRPLPQVDPTFSGSIEINFGSRSESGAAEAICKTKLSDQSKPFAFAQIRVGVEKLNWCIEPFQFFEPGKPINDASGLWFGGNQDPGWALAIAQQGFDGHTRQTAISMYFDRKGAPRWALAAGDVVNGQANLDWLRFTRECETCESKSIENGAIGVMEIVHEGFCGARELVWSTTIQNPQTGEYELVKRDQTLTEFSRTTCY